MADLICRETHNLDFDDQKNDQESINVESERLLLMESDEMSSVCLMFEKERDHLPKEDYVIRLRNGELNSCDRNDALDWIMKANTLHSFGALTGCLAINYLDRFLSVYETPRGKTWIVQLLAVACLSLAAKMEEIKVPLTVDLQVGDPKYIFEGKTIKRMELLVLSTLKWRMQAFTPCSFIDYFLRKINNDPEPPRSLIHTSNLYILNTMKGIDLLEFRPSEIAAAVGLFVSGERQAVCIEKAMSCFIHVDKVRVLKCLEVIKDLALMSDTSRNAAGPSAVPQSPDGVLDVACLSYKSDETTVGSCLNSSHTSPDTKRRKLDTPSQGDLN